MTEVIKAPDNITAERVWKFNADAVHGIYTAEPLSLLIEPGWGRYEVKLYPEAKLVLTRFLGTIPIQGALYATHITRHGNVPPEERRKKAKQISIGEIRDDGHDTGVRWWHFVEIEPSLDSLHKHLDDLTAIFKGSKSFKGPGLEFGYHSPRAEPQNDLTAPLRGLGPSFGVGAAEPLCYDMDGTPCYKGDEVYASDSLDSESFVGPLELYAHDKRRSFPYWVIDHSLPTEFYYRYIRKA